MRRPSVLAVIGMVLTTVITGLLASCAARPVTPDATAQEKIRTALIRQVEALPGATITADIESGLDSGQNNVSVNARLLPSTATVAQINALGDSIERTIWLSHLDPLGRVSLSFTLPGSSEPDQRRRYLGDDKDALGVKYGPRPDGLTGY